MYRLLKPKNIHRALIGLILLAPLLYLFGTQVGALAGAHGEEVIAQEPYQEEWVETDSFSGTHEYKFIFYKNLNFPNPYSLLFEFDFHLDSEFYSRDTFVGLRLRNDGTRRWMDYILASDPTRSTTPYNTIYANPWVQYPNWATIYFSSSSLPDTAFLQWGMLYYKNVDSTSNYFDSLFGDMFGKSNFLTEWGEDALSENRHGFAPVGELFKYVDDNMLHLSDKQIGKMAYGYMYYVVHVLIFDIVALAFVFVVTIPQKVLNMINDKTGGDL